MGLGDAVKTVNTVKTVKVGIVGYTGMVGQELMRLLSAERDIDVEFAYLQNSTAETGDYRTCDVIFLATKDAASMEFAPRFVKEGLRVIDMSGAFRLSRDDFEKWYHMEHTCPELLDKAVYGMPALYLEQIAKATLIANPGCYATSVILPLYALHNMVVGEATIVSTSGNSGARKTVEDVANDWRYSYGKKHKHVPEMIRYGCVEVNFTPIVLRSVYKGINTNIRIKLRDELAYLDCDKAREKLEQCVRDAFVPDDLVSVVRDGNGEEFGTKCVNDTNAMIIKIDVEDGYAYINSCIDNLGKGAASQAIENMRIMLGMNRHS